VSSRSREGGNREMPPPRVRMPAERFMACFWSFVVVRSGAQETFAHSTCMWKLAAVAPSLAITTAQPTAPGVVSEMFTLKTVSRSAAPALAEPEAGDDVVVHEPRGLHERVADRRPDEAEAAPVQVAAHGARLGRLRRYLAKRAPAPDEGLASHKPPEVGVKARRCCCRRRRGSSLGNRRPGSDASGNRKHHPDQTLGSRSG
jgi:hypothetical protein